jgi:hypothetical protein
MKHRKLHGWRCAAPWLALTLGGPQTSTGKMPQARSSSRG